LKQKAEELQEELLEGEQSWEMSEEVRRHRCRQIYKKVFGKDVEFGEDFELDLHFIHDRDREFVKEIVNAEIKLPKIKSLILCAMWEDQSEYDLFCRVE
jgi:hypothetical protein